jgi:hypothetical protein
MPIPVNCQCGQSFRAKDDLAGKRVKCPKCGQPIQIPGADSSGSASASGLMSIDDLMRMDAAAPAGPMPNMPAAPMQNVPGMQQGMPGGFPQTGGYVPPGMGGFQSPNPFFAQPGARPRSSGGDNSFKVAMLALGGISALAVIAMVLIFVLRDKGPDNTEVSSTTPLTTGPTTSTNTGPGTNTQGTATQGTTTQGTTTQGTAAGTTLPAGAKPFRPQSYAHQGFDTPEGALDGFLQAIDKGDSTALRAMMRDMVGPSWDAVEKFVEDDAQKNNGTAAEAWRRFAEGAKEGMIGKLVERRSAQTVAADLAVLTVEVKAAANLPTSVQKQKLVAKDANGKWHLALEEQEHQTALARYQALGVNFAGATSGTSESGAPTLASGLRQYYGEKDLRGAWLVEADDQPHMAWGWMSELLPYIGHEELHRKIDFKKPFFRDPNRSLANTVIPQFLNPSDNRRKIREFSFYRGMAVSHFAGVSGIEDRRQVVAAALPRSDPRAGVFGYDRIAKPSEITDGTSNTVMVIGVDMPRPWIQGGGATIRGAREPYFGGVTGSQFGTRGQNGAIAVMADGSVRLISSSVDPAVFRRMCTIRGAESVDLAPFPPKEDFFRRLAPAKEPGDEEEDDEPRKRKR